MSRTKPEPLNARAAVKVGFPRWTEKQILARSLVVIRFECRDCGLPILDVGRSLDESLADTELMVPGGVSEGVVTSVNGKIKAHLTCRRCGRPDEQMTQQRLTKMVDAAWQAARAAGVRHAVHPIPL